ncbi:MAG: UbiX family flavin prenyltransferase [Candidatus Thermoplasmatota archaeon]|nr:UbiX family flavin prenyltransferase [Candidatus Thermoplasmatota archaeon]
MKKVILAVTGASGIIYGIRSLEELKKAGCNVYLIISENAKKIIKYETEYDLKKLVASVDEYFEENDMTSKLASGSFQYDYAVIAPCSMKTMGAIANGYTSNLITRMAMCTLKEERKLILVPRETPLDLISLENMIKLKKSGAVILPAMPAFYHKPKQIDDVVNHIVGKILDQLGIEHSLFKRWDC